MELPERSTLYPRHTVWREMRRLMSLGRGRGFEKIDVSGNGEENAKKE